MSEYRVKRKSELSHAYMLNDSRRQANAKYIRREKVGDRWKYWYPEDIEAERRAKAAKMNVGTAQKKVESETNLNVLSKKGRNAATKSADNTRYEKLIAEHENQQVEALKDKNIGKLTKSTLKRRHTQVMKLLNSIGNGKLDDKLESGVKGAKAGVKNIKSKVQKGMDVVKDKLGFDEREAYKKQQAKEIGADVNRAVQIKEARINKDLPREGNYKENAKKAFEYDIKYRNEVKKTQKARDEYYNTPVGKIAKATDKVRDAVKGKTKLNINEALNNARNRDNAILEDGRKAVNKEITTKNIQQHRQPAGDFTSNRNAISKFDVKKKKRVYN